MHGSTPALTVAPWQDLVPARASGVVLHGPMAGSGYQQAPSLVRRGDGQAIQLTPLLYAVLCAVDGRRTWAEVARVVASDVLRPVTAEDVHHLAVHRLRPAGLLQLADGSAPAVRSSQPLLGLRFRVGVSRPDLTRLIATPFAPLFAPVVMVPVLLAFVVSTWWAMVDQGVGSGIEEALADPALVLALVIATILSAAFHEIGHASACRYSGAQPGAMGAALYLVWPVFYTDVTDSYRLGRAGRLRVDLGGLYFNALFAVAAVGLWWVTRTDAILLLVPIQLVQMLRQLIPLVRFDGYHILADITGVPDLFARIRPTLLRLIGRPDPSARPLKTWVAVVVGMWVLLVTPALLGLFAVMAWHLPAIVQSAAESMTVQWQALLANLEGGEQTRAALGVVALLTIGLVPLGTVVLLTRMTGRLTRGFVTVTQDHQLVRVSAGVLALVLVASLGPTWMPEGRVAPRMVAAEAGAREAPPVSATAEVADLGERVAPVAAQPAARAFVRDEGAATAYTSTAAGSTTVATAGQPTLAVVGVDDWPFPFDPPADARPGDNVVVAVNTIDGSALFEMTSQLAWIAEGTIVDPRNVAYAGGSCTDCTTTAVAFQVIIAIGHVDVAVPVNEAVAVNHECTSCTTEAVAVQLMVTLQDEPTAELLAQIEQLWAQVEQLEEDLEGQPPAVIHQELTRVRDEIVGVVAAGGGSTIEGGDLQDAEADGSTVGVPGTGEVVVDRFVRGGGSGEGAPMPDLRSSVGADVQEGSAYTRPEPQVAVPWGDPVDLTARIDQTEVTDDVVGADAVADDTAADDVGADGVAVPVPTAPPATVAWLPDPVVAGRQSRRGRRTSSRPTGTYELPGVTAPPVPTHHTSIRSVDREVEVRSTKRR